MSYLLCFVETNYSMYMNDILSYCQGYKGYDLNLRIKLFVFNTNNHKNNKDIMEKDIMYEYFQRHRDDTKVQICVMVSHCISLVSDLCKMSQKGTNVVLINNKIDSMDSAIWTHLNIDIIKQPKIYKVIKKRRMCSKCNSLKHTDEKHEADLYYRSLCPHYIYDKCYHKVCFKTHWRNESCKKYMNLSISRCKFKYSCKYGIKCRFKHHMREIKVFLTNYGVGRNKYDITLCKKLKCSCDLTHDPRELVCYFCGVIGPHSNISCRQIIN